MALTPEQIRQQDAQRRADAAPPSSEPPGGIPVAIFRGAVATLRDLPTGRSTIGDFYVVLVDDEAAGAATMRYWDGTAWLPLAGGGGGGGTAPDTIDIAALLTGIQNGQPITWDASHTRFHPGALVPE